MLGPFILKLQLSKILSYLNWKNNNNNKNKKINVNNILDILGINVFGYSIYMERWTLGLGSSCPHWTPILVSLNYPLWSVSTHRLKITPAEASLNPNLIDWHISRIQFASFIEKKNQAFACSVLLAYAK